ncbi:hypothetical protein SLS62_006010 [Diatrype stigma]|uniref:Uncharacterized protein n=1 Tax=Diatrype stigma TaxID=117547 RepID=A0AAN9YPC9_9PEZI
MSAPISASFALGPPKESPTTLFLKSQFCASPQWPPAGTDLTGKTAIVAGATSGLGLEASRQLLRLGLSGLVIAARSAEKGERVAADLRARHPAAEIRVWPLEMESYESVRAFARRAAAQLPRLDIAILNAGLQAARFERVPATGHKRLVQVNYLSTALLAILLLPVLRASSKGGTGGPGRLSIVSSGTARGARLAVTEEEGGGVLAALDDASRPWSPVERYAVSKLLGHLFMIELARHVSADEVVVNLVDPGLVKDTALQGFAPPLVAAFFYCYKAVLGRTVPVGASTYVDAAVVKGAESHGCYVANWKISP